MYYYTRCHTLEVVNRMFMLSVHIRMMIRVSITMSMETMPIIFHVKHEYVKHESQYMPIGPVDTFVP
jgi:hypothetical protein